jgi:pyruvate,water dikinase
MYRLLEKGQRLVQGRSVGEKIARGPVRIVESAKNLHRVQNGDVLVTDKTDPDWEPMMKKAAAIVTNRGGRTCHAAIVSRELGLPAIVGTENGTERLADSQPVTVSCAEGDTGFVYKNYLKFDVQRTNLRELPRPRTKVMLNVGSPQEAFRLSFMPNDGVGLAREEFIISNYIKVHPLALLDYDHLEDRALRGQIAQLTAGYEDKPQFFVDKLAQGVAMIAAAFYPKDVIVRLSDFKTNEYANLVGGKAYEPLEENPMIGFRGASRYYDPRYQAGFALECRAMRKVRDEMGLTNVKLMIPFCRTVEEGRRVLNEMEKHGLKRGVNELEVYVMCEIPSNVILASDFADIFDGFSIGSNDLTQLILGVDRDSEIVAHVFDERNPAVKTMIASVIRAAREKRRKIGICGQAPSDYPDFAAFLVELGIDSISLNPDAVLKTTLRILEMEAEIKLPQAELSARAV